jgi:hypothetical protein
LVKKQYQQKTDFSEKPVEFNTDEKVSLKFQYLNLEKAVVLVKSVQIRRKVRMFGLNRQEIPV